ncbi:MAG: hypothetical protein MI923_15535 [Phycisphaerales bacterium]|nr:hypothetical protein [Phycisphaerales bacterium]
MSHVKEQLGCKRYGRLGTSPVVEMPYAHEISLDGSGSCLSASAAHRQESPTDNGMFDTPGGGPPR